MRSASGALRYGTIGMILVATFWSSEIPILELSFVRRVLQGNRYSGETMVQAQAVKGGVSQIELVAASQIANQVFYAVSQADSKFQHIFSLIPVAAGKEEVVL